MKQESITFKLISVLFATVMNSLSVFKYSIDVIEFTLQTLPIFPKYNEQQGNYEFRN